MNVEWLPIDNDWMSQACCLARANKDGKWFWKVVAYEDIQDVLSYRDQDEVFDAVGLGKYQKNPECHGYRYDRALFPDSCSVPPDVLEDLYEKVQPVFLVSHVVYYISHFFKRKF